MGVSMIRQFSHLVGNTNNISLIKKSLERKGLPQFILLSGVQGTGKSTVAELIGMALSCEDAKGGEPCGVCAACISNLQALDKAGGGVSPYIEKVNMARVAKVGNIEDKLKSTFQILHAHDVHVKVFEEFHSLKEEDQRLLLEETTRMPANTFVILTTTKEALVLKEIVSRCLVFHFGRLTLGESNLLVDRLNKNLKLKTQDYKLIYKKADGIPRNLTILVDFLSKTEPSQEEISHLLGVIDKSYFLSVLKESEDFVSYIDLVEELETKYPVDVILLQFKDFLVKLLFAIEGSIFDYFTKADISSLGYTTELVYSMIRLVEACSADTASLNILFLKVRRLLCPAMEMQTQRTIAQNSKVHQQLQSTEGMKTPNRFNVGGV